MSEDIDTSCSIVLEKLNSDLKCSSLLLRTLLFCFHNRVPSSVLPVVIASLHCVQVLCLLHVAEREFGNKLFYLSQLLICVNL